jgi:hypothetical protein
MASSLLAPAPFTALLPATGGGRGGWAPPRRTTNVTGPTPPPNLLYVDGENFLNPNLNCGTLPSSWMLIRHSAATPRHRPMPPTLPRVTRHRPLGL